MDTSIALISSVTHAMKGRKALEKYGIRASMERNKNYGLTDSCAYILRIKADAQTVRTIFSRECVKVKSITQEGRMG